jgi:hypothetical protein
MIEFSTDVTSGLFNGNSATWGAGSSILVDDLILEPAGLPVGISNWSLE